VVSAQVWLTKYYMQVSSFPCVRHAQPLLSSSVNTRRKHGRNHWVGEGDFWTSVHRIMRIDEEGLFFCLRIMALLLILWDCCKTLTWRFVHDVHFSFPPKFSVAALIVSPLSIQGNYGQIIELFISGVWDADLPANLCPARCWRVRSSLL